MIFELRQVLPLRLQISTLFVFLMWLFFQVYQPWEPIDQDLLFATGSFDNVTDLSDWVREHGKLKWSDDTGFVSLTPTSRLRFSLPAFAGDLLLCSGRIKTDALKAGNQPWDAARILVYFEDDKGKVRWSHPHNVGYLSGDHDWQVFTQMIEVPQFARKGWIELANYGVSGVASFDDVMVRPALWKQTYSHWQMFFGMFWASIMMWLVLNGHLWSVPWGKSVLICGLIIIVGVTLPPTTMFQVASSGAKLSQKFLHTAEGVLPDGQKKASINTTPAVDTAQQTNITEPEDKQQASAQIPSPKKITQKITAPPSANMITSTDFQKLGHSLLFALLGFLAVKAFVSHLSIGLISYGLVLFAVSTEVLQLVIDGRLFGVVDLALDMLGIFSGALVGWLISRARLAM